MTISFRTEIKLEPAQKAINHSMGLLLLGSCFSTNIGQRFLDQRFNALVNPFGVLYNPLSIAECLQLLIERKQFSESDLVCHNNLWHSWLHHGSFSHVSVDECLMQINTSIKTAADCLQTAEVLLITFGTARVYRLLETRQVVANCHKVPAREFSNERLLVTEIVSVWQKVIANLLKINPRLRIVFTVSPIRHWKDGAHDNQLSKASLLLAVEALQQEFRMVDYFPAYELLMDDLRDYRFYEADMLHPNSVAIEYVWQQFGNQYFSSQTQQLNKQIKDILQAAAHRPLHGQTPQYRSFVESTLQKIDLLEKQNQGLDFSPERKKLEASIA